MKSLPLSRSLRCVVALLSSAAFFLSGTPALAADPDKDYAKHYEAALQQALEIYQQGEHRQAITACNDLIARMPREGRGDYAGAYVIRGLAKAALGETGGAEADLGEALRLSPKSPEYYRYRAEVRMRDDRVREALVDIDQAIALARRQPEASYFVLRAEANLALKAYDAAVHDASEAIVLDPKSPDAFQVRGLAYASRLETSSAWADFSRAIELEPENIRGWNLRGFSAYSQGHWDDAITSFQRSIALRPNLRVAALGYSYFGAQRYEEAVVAFEWAKSATELDRLAVLSLILRDEALRRIGRPDEQLALMAHASPDNQWLQAAERFFAGKISEVEFTRLAAPDNEGAAADRRRDIALFIGFVRLRGGDKDGARASFESVTQPGANDYPVPLAQGELRRLGERK